MRLRFMQFRIHLPDMQLKKLNDKTEKNPEKRSLEN